MLSAWILCAHLAAACSITLYAESTPINIWNYLFQLAPQTSFVLCLTGSSSTHFFTLDDTSSGPYTQSQDLVIQ